MGPALGTDMAKLAPGGLSLSGLLFCASRAYSFVRKPGGVVGTAGWEPLGFFAMRAPLLPFDEFERLAQSGVEALGPRIVELFRRPEVHEALFLASPSLEERLSLLLAGGEEADLGKLQRPLSAYLARMATRPTPFGLFAACSAGQVAEHTALIVSGELRRRTRPDMDFLVTATARLCEDREVRRALTWWPNSSLYRSAGRIRMVETRLKGRVRSHHLMALEADEPLLAVLSRAHDGASIDELTRQLVDEDVTFEDAVEYVHEMIDAQVLVAALTPAVTGPEPLDGLVAELKAVGEQSPVAAKAAETLGRTAIELAKLDAGGLGESPSAYHALAGELRAVVAEAELSRLFQVDLFRSGPAPTIGPAVVAEAARAVDVLALLAPEQSDPLASFKGDFVARYESAEVPLLEALDEESGIGFGVSSNPLAEEAPILAGLELGPGVAAPGSWTAREDVLFEIVSEALRTGKVGVELDGGLIERLAAASRKASGPALQLAPTVSVMGRVAAESGQAVDKGSFTLLVQGVSGCSGAQLLGRFCHGDADLEAGVRQMLRREESFAPDAVFAEVVHLPEGRIGNILSRPVLREHEIAYLGRSGASPAAQIPPEDLMVSVGVEGVRLRSKRLDREVLPRLTSAHNTALQTLGVYRFLAALQAQRRLSGLAWDWGPFEKAPFLPRVTCGRLVLSRARWRFRGMRHAEDLQALRARWMMPRWVAVAEGDNEWVLDMDNSVLTETALDPAKQSEEIGFVEMFPPPEELCAPGPGGRYVHELIIPLARPAPPESTTRRRREVPDDRSHPSVPRKFSPGSEWLYAKIYTGTGSADRVLREAVGPAVRATIASGAADRWFFVRYADPEPHLRLRVHGRPDRLRAEVEPLVGDALAALIEDGTVWRLGYDTYHREVERYGGPEGIGVCEGLFAADSDAVLAIVERLSGDAGLEARWRLCVAGIDRLLDDFGLELAARHEWARRLAAAYFDEFSSTSGLARQLGQRWRDHGRDLEGLLAWDGDDDHPLAPGMVILAERSVKSGPAVAEMRRLAEAGRITAPLGDVVASLAHMHANRLLRSGARAQEMVIYELVSRLYAAKLARDSQ